MCRACSHEVLLPVKAVEVDDEHAVLVRDKSTGQVRLVTEKQLFVPGPNETIESLNKPVLLVPSDNIPCSL